MRRAHLGENSHGAPQYQQSQMLEDENTQMVDALGDKVKALKSLSIDIGTEVRSQNQMLGEMDSDFDNTQGILKSSMNRVLALAKAGHGKLYIYLALFSLFVFFLIWLIIKFR